MTTMVKFLKINSVRAKPINLRTNKYLSSLYLLLPWCRSCDHPYENLFFFRPSPGCNWCDNVKLIIFITNLEPKFSGVRRLCSVMVYNNIINQNRAQSPDTWKLWLYICDKNNEFYIVTSVASYYIIWFWNCSIVLPNNISNKSQVSWNFVSKTNTICSCCPNVHVRVTENIFWTASLQ